MMEIQSNKYRTIHLDHVHTNKTTPSAGIEPATTRLRVVRSTDWATTADIQTTRHTHIHRPWRRNNHSHSFTTTFTIENNYPYSYPYAISCIISPCKMSNVNVAVFPTSTICGLSPHSLCTHHQPCCPLYFELAKGRWFVSSSLSWGSLVVVMF